jgi:hypothetical protein
MPARRCSARRSLLRSYSSRVAMCTIRPECTEAGDLRTSARARSTHLDALSRP